MPPALGYRALSVLDPQEGLSFPAHLLYPSQVPSAGVALGPWRLEATRDAAPAPQRCPVALISHGTGGTPLAYPGLAQYLAAQGWVVAMPRHHGNHREDNSLEGTARNLALRPRHLSLLLDALAADELLGGLARTESAAVIGHSMGGCAALAVAGGQPRQGWHPGEGLQERVPVVPDPRVKALVLLAPAVWWFGWPGALEAITAPVLYVNAERDEPMPAGWHAGQAESVREALGRATQLAYRVEGGSGHFFCMGPFPEALRVPGFMPASDPPGFDRAACQARLWPEILAFLRASPGIPAPAPISGGHILPTEQTHGQCQ